MPQQTLSDARLRSVTLRPGVRLHVLSSARFTTTLVRVTLHRDLGPEATATSLLGHVLESATERHPSREAISHRLADLYGAGLSVGVEKLGDRQLLVASVDWPSSSVPGRGASLADGLGFLREVLIEPKRVSGGLDPAIVATEARNLSRSLAALRDDKARYALRRCLETACRGEPFALDVEGRVEDVPAATPSRLADLHRRLLSTAPVEIYVAGDHDAREARAAVTRHLLWPGRAARPAAVPAVASVRAPRRAPARLVESDRVVQGKLAMAFRAPIAPDSPLLPAALVLAGVLGGTSVSRLFKVVRETHGLCYYASASWIRSRGLMLVQAGVDPKNEPKARRLIEKLTREVASGSLDTAAFEAVREAARARVAAMQDERGSTLSYAQEMLALGLDPRPKRHLDALLAVTPADVRRAGRALRLEASFFLTSSSAGAEASPSPAPSSSGAAS